jgi:hypothetical protein
MMYSDVVMEKAAGIEPKDGHGIRHSSKQSWNTQEARVGAKDGHRPHDAKTSRNWRAVQGPHQGSPRSSPSRTTPTRSSGRRSRPSSSPGWASAPSTTAASRSIPDEWGTAVNVQAMVFGNMGDTSERASPSRAIPPPARTPSTANGSPTRRAKTSSPASARPTPPEEARSQGPEGPPSSDLLRLLTSSSTRSAPPREALLRHARHRVHHREGEALGCSSAALASATAPPRSAWPSRCARRKLINRRPR